MSTCEAVADMYNERIYTSIYYRNCGAFSHTDTRTGGSAKKMKKLFTHLTLTLIDFRSVCAFWLETKVGKDLQQYLLVIYVIRARASRQRTEKKFITKFHAKVKKKYKLFKTYSTRATKWRYVKKQVCQSLRRTPRNAKRYPRVHKSNSIIVCSN